MKKGNKIFWDKSSVEKLKKHYPNKRWEELEKMFPSFTKKQILAKAGKLKLKREFTENCGGRTIDGKEYSREEIIFIKNNYSNMSYEEISFHLGRGLSSVSNKINSMGIFKMDMWKKDEEERLISVYPYYSNRHIIEEYFPERTNSSIVHKAKKLGLVKKDGVSYSRISKKYAKDKLIELYKKIGRTPIHSELVPNGLPSLATYRLLFGNYTNACLEAGLNPNFSKVGLGRKSVLLSKENDVCYSIYEQIITNFFIDNGIKYKKEERYSTYSSDIRCKTKKVDWVLRDMSFVEYWGFPNVEKYRNQMNIKIDICKKSKINLIQLFVQDINELHTIFDKYIS